MRLNRRFAQPESSVNTRQKQTFMGQKPENTAWMLGLSQTNTGECTIPASPRCARPALDWWI